MVTHPQLGPLVATAAAKGELPQVLIPHRHQMGDAHHWHAGAVVKRTHVPGLGDYLTVVVPGRRDSPLPAQHPRERGRWLSLVTVRERDAVALDPPDPAISHLMELIATDYAQTGLVRTVTSTALQHAIDATGPIERWAHRLTDTTARGGGGRRPGDAGLS